MTTASIDINKLPFSWHAFPFAYGPFVMKQLIFLLLLPFFSVQAAEVLLNDQGLTLNADLEGASPEKLPARMYLVLHGTLGHKNMEIIQGLQAGLAENGLASLAPNLSLNINDRHGFYDCATPHYHRHEDAVAELQAWADWLAQRGVRELDLIGHSRGGNQVLLFALHARGPKIASVTSIAPMSFKAPMNKNVLQGLAGPRSLKIVPRFLHCRDTQVSRQSLESYGFNPDQHTPALWRGYKGAYRLVLGSEDPLSLKLKPELNSLPAGARWIELDGADHFFRDLYLDDVLDFLLENRE